MIIDELTLYDFGIYAGQQSVKLNPPSPKKPVTIFYGLNGCGKTTILEALQVALFGQQAPFLEGGNYKEYIKQRINKHSRYGQASLRLDFHRSENGQLTHYRIYRVWKRTLSGVKETLEVIKDGHKSKILSSNWHSYVEEIISAKLAHFFFFDGERIEQYASEKGAQELLHTGLHSLLGLDLLNRAEQDLKTLKQRKLSANVKKGDDSIKGEIKEKKSSLAKLEKQKRQLTMERAKIQTHEVDLHQREIDKINEDYKNIGGDLWERQENIKVDLSNQKEQKNKNDALIREAVSGILPLSIVREWFSDIEQHKKAAEENERTQLHYTITKERDEQTLSFMQEMGAEAKMTDRLAEILEIHRQKLVSNSKKVSIFTNARELEGFDKVSLEAELDAVANTLNTHIEKGQSIDEQISHLMAEELSIPDSAEVKKLLEQKHQTEMALAKSKQSLEQVDSELGGLKDKISKVNKEIDALMRQILVIDAEGKKAEKYIQRIEDAGGVLQSFSKSILESKVENVERLILESYQILLRKENMVNKIAICPKTLQILLHDRDGKTVENSQLSAGERQLLSISILWGLAKASSKPFPVAVDTPFGRLDSIHRTKLVSNYFTQASHQVLLFSTDEEVVEKYFKIIKPSVGWIYRLDYSEQHSSTEVRLDDGIS